jgi:hypothetical protein
MNITRDIVLDLLPLYVAGEASQASRTAIESFLEADPELAGQVEQMALPGMKEIPRVTTQETEMDAYKKANLVMAIRTIALALILAGVFLALVLIVPAIYLAIR